VPWGSLSGAAPLLLGFCHLKFAILGINHSLGYSLHLFTLEQPYIQSAITLKGW